MLTVLSRIRLYIRPYRARMVAAIVAMIGVDGLAYIVPLAIGYVTDHVYPRLGTDPSALRTLWVVSGALLLTAATRGVLAHVMIRNFWSVAEAGVREVAAASDTGRRIP